MVGDDDQTIYQWRGSEVSNIVTFADRYAGVRQVTLADNFRSSEGIVELGRSVAERIPTGNRLPKAMVRAGHQTVANAATCSPRPSTIATRRGGLDLRPDRGDARARVQRHSRRRAAGAVVVGLRGAVPLGRQGRRPARRRAAAPGHPVRGQGLNRLFDSPEIQAVVGDLPVHGRTRSTAADLRSAVGRRESPPGDARTGLKRSPSWTKAATSTAGERWGVYNIQRLYLEFLEALELREETVPGDPVRRELVFYQLGKFSQAISDFEQIYFNTEPQAEVRGVRRSGSSTRRPTTTRSPTPTSGTRRRTP